MEAIVVGLSDQESDRDRAAIPEPLAAPPEPPLQPSTSMSHRHSSNAVKKKGKSRRGSKATTKFEKEKDKAPCSKASSQRIQDSHARSGSSHACGRHSLVLSPEGAEGHFSPPTLVFPISTSGLWGSVSNLHTPIAVSDQPQSSVRAIPEATFTPMAAGLHPESQPDPLTQPNLQDIIANAIRQGIAAGLQDRFSRALNSTHSTLVRYQTRGHTHQPIHNTLTLPPRKRER